MKKTDASIKVQISLGALLGLMALFTLARAAIFWTNASLFEPLSAAEIGRAFVNGLRFDFYISALFLGPIIFLLNWPVKSKTWTKIWTTVLLSECIFLAGFLVADFVYFPKVGRHIGEEILQISNDWGYIVSYMLTQFWWVLLLLFGGLFVVVRLLFAYINRACVTVTTWTKSAGTLVIILLAILLGLRGHLGGGKSLGVADVYRYVSTAQGAALALNGAFTAYQVGRKGAQEFNNNFPLQKAIDYTQKYLVQPTEKVPDSTYPLMRQNTQTVPLAKQPNIFIVLLEGWHPDYIDGLSHKDFGATPVFDELLKNGVNFTNAYAAGQRSIFGFAAVMAGLPLVPGLPLFGYGLELSELSPMPKHFARAGYYTFFAQTSHRDSYRLCALASYLGMQDSFGWEDIPQRLPYKQKAPFGYDYDALQFAADQIAKHPGQPFMGMVFTGITHEPFVSTLPQFDKYPYDNWEHGFLNSLEFADWSIGELLARARKDGWFDNTIFVFVADHTSGGSGDGTLKSHFHIPLLIYAPQYYKAQEIKEVVSQLDIVPTLYNMAGIAPAYTAFGRSLFDRSLPHQALVSEGDTIGLITAQGAVRHSGQKLLSVEPYTDHFDADKAQEDLLALDKAAYTLLKENRWYHAPESER